MCRGSRRGCGCRLRCRLRSLRALLCVTSDAAADMIYHGVLVCVLMSLNCCVRGIDQTRAPSLSSRSLHLFHIHPSVLSFVSISPSLCFLCVSVLSFPSLHLCLFYIHLSIEPPSLLPSFSLTEREIINIKCVSLLLSLPVFPLPPSLSLFFFF